MVLRTYFLSANMHNKPLKFVPATKGVSSTGLATARRLAERYTPLQKEY